MVNNLRLASVRIPLVKRRWHHWWKIVHRVKKGIDFLINKGKRCKKKARENGRLNDVGFLLRLASQLFIGKIAFFHNIYVLIAKSRAYIVFGFCEKCYYCELRAVSKEKYDFYIIILHSKCILHYTGFLHKSIVILLLLWWTKLLLITPFDSIFFQK